MCVSLMMFMTMINREGNEGFVRQADGHASWHTCLTVLILFVFNPKACFPQISLHYGDITTILNRTCIVAVRVLGNLDLPGSHSGGKVHLEYPDASRFRLYIYRDFTVVLLLSFLFPF